MHIRFRFIFIAAVALSLVGCATSLPDGAQFELADGSKAFVVSQRHFLKTGTPGMPGFLRGSEEIVIMPGQYSAKHQNAFGTFYLGPNPAFVERVNSWVWSKPNLLLQHAGGIWVPATGEAKPRLWIYPGSFSRVEGESSQADGDVALDIATRNIAQRSMPAMNPAQAGIGSGIAAGLVGAIVESGRNSPMLTNNELIEGELSKSIADQVSLHKN